MLAFCQLVCLFCNDIFMLPVLFLCQLHAITIERTLLVQDIIPSLPPFPVLFHPPAQLIHLSTSLPFLFLLSLIFPHFLLPVILCLCPLSHSSKPILLFPLPLFYPNAAFPKTSFPLPSRSLLSASPLICSSTSPLPPTLSASLITLCPKPLPFLPILALFNYQLLLVFLHP